MEQALITQLRMPMAILGIEFQTMNGSPMMGPGSVSLATEVETFIPAGSFQGGYGVYSGSSGWSIYEFAYIKKGNGYEFLDLFRYDKDVSE